MSRKNGIFEKGVTFFVCAVLLAAMGGMSFAAGPIWTQTGVNAGAAYRMSLSPGYRTDKTAFWVWGDNNICKTANGFSTWTTVYTTGDPSKKMQTVGASPSFSSDSTVFVGSAKPDSSGTGSVVKSTNGGLSWAPAALGTYSIIHAESVAYSPTFNGGSGRVFIGTNKGGLSTNNGLGVVYSDNGGNAWNGSTGLPNDAGVVSLSVSPAYSTDHTVFAAVDKDNTTGSVYKSINSGASWSKLTMAKFDSGSAFNAVGVAVSPDYSNDQTVFAVSQFQGLYKSADGGSSWTSLTGSQISSAALSPDYKNDHTVFIATYSQTPDSVYMSTDRGGSWQEITTPSENFQVYCLAASPDYQHDRTLYVGTKSNGIWSAAEPSYSLAASPNNALFGSVVVSPASGPYFSDTTVNLTASANTGYRFKNWTGDTSGIADVTNASASFTMGAGSRSLTANFVAVYTLTVNKNTAAGGTVTGGGSYDAGTNDVPVSTTVNAGYIFIGWSGATVADSNSLSTNVLTMDGNKTVTANYSANDGMTLQYAQDGFKVTLNSTFFKAGVPQTGKVVKFYVSLKSPSTGLYGSYSSKASGTVLADGTCTATIAKLSAGTYKLKAEYAATGQPPVDSAQLDCVIGPVVVPAQGVTNPTITADPTPNISWSAFTGATGYIIQTCATSKFEVGTYLESTGIGNVTSADIPVSMSLQRGIKRYWRIIALLPTGRSVPSAAGYITYKENTSFTGLDAQASRMTIRPTVTLAGADSGTPSGKVVTFYCKLDTATSWISLKATTDGSGVATLSLPKTLTASGYYHLYSTFAGDTYFGAATSISSQVAFTVPTP